MQILISRGNRKLPKDHAIINITSATDCPSKAKGLCTICRKCYAMKAERLYPQVLPFRRRQAKIWGKLSARDIADQIIALNARARAKIKFLRFSEAGDFRNQDDVHKMDEIAGYLKPHGINTYGYTARNDLDYTSVRHMVVNGTGFMISNGIELVGDYLAYMDKRCNGACASCSLCKVKGNSTIYFKIH